MAAKRRGLGKGLDALLAGSAAGPEDGPGADADVGAASTPEKGLLRELPIEVIQRGQYQPRREFEPEALQELADSIKAQGVMQPIVVRSVGPDSFEIIAG